MLLDFCNVNTLWCSVLVETLARLGLKNAVICPGSRSTPLTIAFAKNPKIQAIPILDERSAAFFALGRAKRTHKPVVLVCSSGTAGANFYPAIIEATEAYIPLIILTADRPPELRHCHAGQTIDQIKLYGNYPRWYTELALPEANWKMLAYLRQNIVQAWEKSLFPDRGVVHLNCPFREPLAPTPQPDVKKLVTEFNDSDFFAHLNPSYLTKNINDSVGNLDLKLAAKGIIIVGLTQTKQPKEYCQQIALLADKLKYPVLAEALSPLRNYANLNPYLITTYDLILRQPQIAKNLVPETILQIGELPTSKQLRTWLGDLDSTRYIITQESQNFDPLHQKVIHLRISLGTFVNSYQVTINIALNNSYWQTWHALETQTRSKIDRQFQNLEHLYEGKVPWLISQHLPPNTPVFFANSMTVRNAEFFWQPNNNGVIPYFNRGANGIDGTLSTALGIAHGDRPTVMITGDLALLHDTNGFLIDNYFDGHLTIILVNNNGGGIFEILPIAEFEPPFEEYFATPQNINFSRLARTYGIDYQRIENWQELSQPIDRLPNRGIRILEIKTNRKQDANYLKQNIWQTLDS